MNSHGRNRRRTPPDYDRCGHGTPWGCDQYIKLGEEASLVLNACEPEDAMDNGHRLFHSACLPVTAVSINRRHQELDLTERGRRGILRAV